MIPQSNDAWEFWRRSKQSLDALNRLLTVVAPPYLASDRLYPQDAVGEVERNLQRFQESFSCLVHAQKASRP